MKITIDMDEGLIAAIDHAAKSRGISADTVFTKAMRGWVAHERRLERFARECSESEYDPDFIPFEMYRPGPEAMPEFWLPEDRSVSMLEPQGEADDEVPA